jgi:amidophosphoribosyltransferase
MISGTGLLAFRDPYRHPALVIGRNDTPKGTEWMVASEAWRWTCWASSWCATWRPRRPILIDTKVASTAASGADGRHAPCMFEFVYLARPDSMIDGISVLRRAYQDG